MFSQIIRLEETQANPPANTARCTAAASGALRSDRAVAMSSRTAALSLAAVGSVALLVVLQRRRRSPRHRHLAWVTRLLAEKRLAALHREIYVAVNLALECGAAMERATASAVVWKDDGGIDPVTATDQANETLVTETLLRHFPEHRVIGEEAAAAGSGVPTIAASDPPTWYVDPIDGTQNFVHSLPISCVSVGLAVGGASARPSPSRHPHPHTHPKPNSRARRECPVRGGPDPSPRPPP